MGTPSFRFSVGSGIEASHRRSRPEGGPKGGEKEGFRGGTMQTRQGAREKDIPPSHHVLSGAS